MQCQMQIMVDSLISSIHSKWLRPCLLKCRLGSKLIQLDAECGVSAFLHRAHCHARIKNNFMHNRHKVTLCKGSQKGALNTFALQLHHDSPDQCHFGHLSCASCQSLVVLADFGSIV